jgi:hypothetical protein
VALILLNVLGQFDVDRHLRAFYGVTPTASPVWPPPSRLASWRFLAGRLNFLLCPPAIEKVLAPDRLTVLPVLDLDPGRGVRRV